MINILFVCHGNICRSPMAEAMFREKIESMNLNHKFGVDSAGVMAYHRGEPPHSGTISILKEQKISYKGIKSRPLDKNDFLNFDLIVAMDSVNMKNIKSKSIPKDSKAQIRLLSEFVNEDWTDVPDPWYTGDFNLVFRMIEKGISGILSEYNH